MLEKILMVSRTYTSWQRSSSDRLWAYHRLPDTGFVESTHEASWMAEKRGEKSTFRRGLYSAWLRRTVKVSHSRETVDLMKGNSLSSRLTLRTLVLGT